MQRVALMALLVAVLVLSVACSSKTPQSRPQSTAVLSIVKPAPGDVIAATKVRVRLTLAGARIIPDTRPQLAPDEGHIHLNLNGKIVSMTYGLDQEVAVEKGPQLLEAEFVAGDHLPFSPRVIRAVTFTVR